MELKKEIILFPTVELLFFFMLLSKIFKLRDFALNKKFLSSNKKFFFLNKSFLFFISRVKGIAKILPFELN